MSQGHGEDSAGPRFVGPGARVAMVTLALTALAVLGALHVGSRAPVLAGVRLPWWGVVVLTVACELTVLHVQVRREAHVVSLSDIALVPVLFFADPLDGLAGWTAGTLAVCLLRRQSPMKTAFNVALSGAGMSLARAVFHALQHGGPEVDPWGWLAALASTAGVSLLDTLAVLLVIALVEGDVDGEDVPGELGRGLVTAAMTTTVALVAVHAVHGNPVAVVPVTVCLTLLIVGYRGYSALAERHLGLERIHRVSRVLNGTPEVDELLSRLLHQTRDALLAERVEVAFLPAGDTEPTPRVALDPAEGVRRTELPPDVARHPVWRRVVEDAAPVVLPRSTREPDERGFLDLCGLQDAVLVPLRGDTGVIGVVLAGDRMGEVRSFEEHDLRLLVTISEQAAAALGRGELADRLRHETEHDALTGLPNRILLHRRLAEAAASVRAGASQGYAVLVVNLVDFRAVNEVLGHAIGDHVLEETARRLAGACTPGDTVARLGGDEFAVLLPGVACPDAAVAGAGRVADALQQPFDVTGIDVEVGAWIGVSVCPTHGDDAEAVLQQAESALTTARRDKVEVQLYVPTAQPRQDPARLALLGELRHAVHHDQLAMFVQPKADALTGAVASVEALVRWRHPERGLVPPMEFIPLAERTGLFRPLTSWMLARAVESCGQWRRGEGPLPTPALNIAVNLSPRSILDPDLPGAVEALLRLHRVPATDLTLEITESSVLDDPQRTRDVLERLRALGVRISIDDFGTGYSSMSYLRDLPADEVKIDRTFVADMLRRPGDEAIVNSIITLARNLGLETVAEGVEDAATWQRLADLGCTRIQGYHLARPMPAQDLPAWLAASQVGQDAASWPRSARHL